MNTAENRAVSRFKPTKNFYVFVVCLALAFFFWLLNVLSKDYVSVINLPVKYQNLPTNKIPMNILPEAFAVTAKVSGYSLIVGSSGEQNDTVIVDGKLFRTIKRHGKLLSFYHVRPLLKQLTTNNYSSYRIEEVLIDTLFVDFNQKTTKILPVVPQIEYTTAKHYVVNGELKLLPSSIKITGPKSILDTMKTLVSKPLSFEELSSSLTTSLSFDVETDNRFELKPKGVIATLEIEKNTESTIEIPIKAINVPKGISLKMFPNKVEATFLVSLSKYEYVNKDDFELIVDYNSISENSSKLSVKEHKSPNFVTLTRIEPGRIEYIIKK